MHGAGGLSADGDTEAQRHCGGDCLNHWEPKANARLELLASVTTASRVLLFLLHRPGGSGLTRLLQVQGQKTVPRVLRAPPPFQVRSGTLTHGEDARQAGQESGGPFHAASAWPAPSFSQATGETPVSRSVGGRRAGGVGRVPRSALRRALLALEELGSSLEAGGMIRDPWALVMWKAKRGTSE